MNTSPNLFSPFRLGDLELKNRMVMAPMTRSRAITGNVPNPLALTYYVQRASAGLLITEATQVSPQGVGYIRTPGIHSQGTLMVNGGYDARTGNEAISRGEAELVSYGEPFVSNPDLPERYKSHSPLAPADRATFFTGEEKGYIDYPALGA